MTGPATSPAKQSKALGGVLIFGVILMVGTISKSCSSGISYTEQQRTAACAEASQIRAAEKALQDNPIAASDSSIGDRVANLDHANNLEQDYNC